MSEDSLPKWNTVLPTDVAHDIHRSRAEDAKALLSSLPGFSSLPEDHRGRTPERFVSMLLEMTTPRYFDFTTFRNDAMDEMIVVDNIEFYTLCAHHVVPFFGVAHVAYIPEKLMVGLSKIPRAVEQKAKGLWVQEDLTKAIADFLQKQLHPRGVAVVMQAEHMCMSMRGVKARGSKTTTSAMRGVFLDPSRGARAEFLSLIRSK